MVFFFLADAEWPVWDGPRSSQKKIGRAKIKPRKRKANPQSVRNYCMEHPGYHRVSDQLTEESGRQPEFRGQMMNQPDCF